MFSMRLVIFMLNSQNTKGYYNRARKSLYRYIIKTRVFIAYKIKDLSSKDDRDKRIFTIVTIFQFKYNLNVI